MITSISPPAYSPKEKKNCKRFPVFSFSREFLKNDYNVFTFYYYLSTRMYYIYIQLTKVLKRVHFQRRIKYLFYKIIRLLYIVCSIHLLIINVKKEKSFFILVVFDFRILNKRMMDKSLNIHIKETFDIL